MMPADVELLLVEDNPSDAELTLRVLTKNRLANQVVWVKDGAEALDFLFARGIYAGRNLNSKPRAILLDLRMPKVDGLEVLSIIKGDERTRDIPVVVLTSSTEAHDLEACSRLGVNRFVRKPVVFEDFVKTISELDFYWLLVNRQPRA